MVFSIDSLHFLKIQNFLGQIHQNYLVALSNEPRHKALWIHDIKPYATQQLFAFKYIQVRSLSLHAII